VAATRWHHLRGARRCGCCAVAPPPALRCLAHRTHRHGSDRASAAARSVHRGVAHGASWQWRKKHPTWAAIAWRFCAQSNAWRRWNSGIASSGIARIKITAAARCACGKINIVAARRGATSCAKSMFSGTGGPWRRTVCGVPS